MNGLDSVFFVRNKIFQCPIDFFLEWMKSLLAIIFAADGAGGFYTTVNMNKKFHALAKLISNEPR